MKRVNVRKLLTGLVAAALTLTAAGCGGVLKKNVPESDGSLQKVLAAGQLVVGLDAEFPPMTFADESGELVGFDVDVAQEICNRLGIKLIKQPIDWNTKEDTLNSGAIDCIWSGMSETPARIETMNLSEPYIRNERIFLVRSDSDARALDDLRGGTVGVQPGTSGQEALEASDIYEDISVVLDVNPKLMQLLRDGKLDAALTDSTFAYYFILTSEERYFVLDDSLGEDEYVIGFRKDDRELRDRVQEIISQMKGDGTLGRISKKWFGSDITTVR